MSTVTRLILLSSISVLLAACAQSSETEKTRVTNVRVVAATTGAAAPMIRTNGMLVNKDELRLSFKVAGVVSRITVQEGQRVKRGQRLAVIEQAEIDAQVEQARQSADKGQRDVMRAEKLYNDRLISIGQLEDLRTQAAMSHAALQSAEFNRSYATITSPQDGTILKRLIQERELVAAGAPVLVLGAQDRGYVVRVGLADREIVQVKIGDVAEVELDAHPDVKFAAQVTEVASGADERSGMFQVELRMAPTKLRLVSGLVAKVALLPASAHSAERVYVPIGAIVEGDGRKASVYVLEGELAKRRSIDVAFIDGTNVAIAQGLAAGEKVVTDGALYLQDGERVLVRDAG